MSWKKILIVFFVSFFSTYLPSYAAETTENTVTSMTFPKSITLDGKEWKLGFQQENEDVIIAEYVTDNETVDNWTQLFTFQKFKLEVPKQITPSLFAEREVQQIEKAGYKVISNVTDATPQEAMLEFRVLSPKAKQQDELQRIIITPNTNLIVLHYVIKKSDMGTAERTKWMSILKSVKDFKLD